ncbi:MAG TPA: AMP-binding protein [Nitrospirales bacterium]|nr:AMP-dependent synthetase [Nitrospiraceae bacterium]HNP31055.1 AMP-binding protein [Nitrospirales bacterium]
MAGKQDSFLLSSECIDLPSVLQNFSEQTPEAIAVVAPGNRLPLTFHRLHRHIVETGNTMNELGVGRGDRVALVLPTGPEMTTASLAVMAHAIGAPLNPALHADEFNFYLSDLKPKALVLQAGSLSPARAVAQARNIPVLELSPLQKEPSGVFTLTGNKSNFQLNGGFAHSDDVTLLLHTSGTTKSSKLVSLTHRNIWTSAHSIRKILELTQRDRCLNIMPLYHIHGLCAVFSSLLAGASVVCPPAFDSQRFFEWLESFRPSWYTAVPTLHQAILNEAADHSEIIARCPLRFIRSASAPLPFSVMTELERVFNAPVIESYGMTEAAPQITSNPLPPRQRKPGSAGLPAGPEVGVMDEHGNLLAAGQTGEVVIRGTNVIQGYEDNPEANREAFINGWFRTGDQGYLDQEGYLFLNGRLKDLINRGGEKIIPREVEGVLLEHPAVAQAVSFSMPHATLGEDVAAAVVLRQGASATPDEIRKFASNRLAHFKVPSRVRIVEEIPHSTTGKVQRLELSEKFGLRQETPAAYAAPRTSIEERLIKIWEEVLNVDHIGIHDNFFELGGESIRMIKVINRLKAVYGVGLPLQSIWDSPTVAGLAKVVELAKQERQDLSQ